MAEEIDLDRLHFSLGCITTADPVQEFYLTKDEVRDLIQDVFHRKQERRGSFKVDAFHRCDWWYDPPRDGVGQVKDQPPPAMKGKKRRGE